MGVLDDEQRLGDQDLRAFDGLPRQQRGRYRLRAAQAQAGLVPIDLAGWLGREPTNSDRVMFHREYGRLERLGLIERCNLHGGPRTTHLRLTDLGRQVAADLLAELEGDDHDPPIDLSAIEFIPIEVPHDSLSPDSCDEAAS